MTRECLYRRDRPAIFARAFGALTATLIAGCVSDLPPLSPVPPAQPVAQRTTTQPATENPPISRSLGIPSLPPPPLGVPPSLSPFTPEPQPTPPPLPAVSAPAPGQYGGQPNNGPVTGYGVGGMQAMPGAPPNSPYR